MEPPHCEICSPEYLQSQRSVSTLTITFTPLGITSETHTLPQTQIQQEQPQMTRLVNHVSFVGKKFVMLL